METTETPNERTHTAINQEHRLSQQKNKQSTVRCPLINDAQVEGTC